MKNRIIPALFAFALLTLSASGLGWNDAIVNGGTNNVPASTTNTYSLSTSEFGLPLWTNAQVEISACLTGAGTVTDSCTFDLSLDNVNWFSSFFSVPFTTAGTNPVTLITNLNIGACPFLRTGQIGNTSAGQALTNIAVHVSPFPAFAQRAQPRQQVDAIYNGTGGPSDVVLAASTNYCRSNSSALFFRYAGPIAFALTGNLSNTSPANISFTVDVSSDAANWTTNALVFYSSYPSSNYVNIVLTNLIEQYFRLGEIRNTNASAYFTNAMFKAGSKQAH